MQYSQTDLTEEIKEEHALIASAEGVVPKSWLCAAVAKRHAEIDGPDSDFAFYCIQAHVSASVDKYIRQVKVREDENDEQTVMEGYTRLQKQYVFQRDVEVAEGSSVRIVKESVIVNLAALTKAEALGKADEHRAMGTGHFEHARELEQFAEGLPD